MEPSLLIKRLWHALQGLMMMPAAAVPAGREGAALLRRLWVHEALRVFQDRLVDDADRDWLLEQASPLHLQISGFLHICFQHRSAHRLTRLEKNTQHPHGDWHVLWMFQSSRMLWL